VKMNFWYYLFINW